MTNHHDNNIRKWIHRFNEDGIDGIICRKHNHSAQKITDEIEKQIVCSSPGKYGIRFSTWSLHMLIDLYDYQILIYDSLITHPQPNKHLWLKKAAGLGISEFMLRFVAWLCLKDGALSGFQRCIVTGPKD